MAFGSHLKALVVKNMRLYKKGGCCSCCEIIWAAIFVLFLCLFRSVIEKPFVPQQSYLPGRANYSLANWDQNTTFSNIIKVLDIQNPTLKAQNFTSQYLAFMLPTFPSNIQSVIIAQNPWIDSAVLAEVNSKQALIKNLMTASQVIKNCSENNKYGGIIAIAGNNQVTQALQSQFRKINYTKIKQFSTNQEMDDYIGNENYGRDGYPSICIGISFKEYNPGVSYKYSLRFNSSEGPRSEIVNTLDIFPRTDPLKVQNIEQMEKYQKTGFLMIQNYIDNLILKIETGNQNAYINYGVASQMTPNYINDRLATSLQGRTDFFIILPYILPYCRNVYRLLYEKEKKISEGMKMMGMSQSSFYTSWIIQYSFVYGVISILISTILKLGIFTASNWGLLFLLFFLFGLVLIAQAIFISVFFTNMKPGVVTAFVFFLIFYLVRIFVGQSDIEESVKIKASISPHTSVSLVMDNILLFEGEGQGISFKNARELYNNYKVSTAFGMLIMNIVAWFTIAIYLDQVFPNEFGAKKHPLFFLSCFFKKNQVEQNDGHLSPEEQKLQDDLKDVVEGVDGTLKKLEAENKALKIQNLYKTYPSGKAAVRGLSMTMYEGQIFALLGHNGAGKTTTISMITGLIDITKGKVNAYGLDVQSQMDDIRHILGVCPQHDILYDDLTVKEHLELFAAFKGMNSSDIPSAVTQMIKDLDLVEKTDQVSKQLSGGQKRRLSVGIALIGNSKLILLDEPTSGMDTSARRFIWEMLKNNKNGKIIILSTHFMNEADFLGDRIGIMGEGQLKCLGSSLYLKNKFGVGYNLTIVKLDQSGNQQIIDFVTSHIPTARILSNVSAEIKFQIPLEEIGLFKQFFSELDKNLKSLNIQDYGIGITTLEEVFLKVAEIDHGQLQFDKKKQEKSDYDNQTQLANQQIDDFDDKIKNHLISGYWSLVFIHFWALMVKRCQYIKRDFKGFLAEVLLPCIIICCGLAIQLVTFIYQPPQLLLNPKNLYSEALPLKTLYGQSPGITSTGLSNYFDQSLYSLNLSSQSDIYSWELEAFSLRERTRKGQFFISQFNQSNQQMYYDLTINSVSPDSLPMYINAINQAFINLVSQKSISIQVYNEPLRLTQRELSANGTINGFLGGLIFVMGMTFIPASIIVFIVKERTQNVKHQHSVSGVSLLSYYGANYMIDLLKYSIPAIFACIMVLAYDIEIYQADDAYSAVWLLYILYGFSMLAFVNIFQFYFKTYGAAQIVIFFLFYVAGAILPIAFTIMRFFESTKLAAVVLIWIFRFIPGFAFGNGLALMANKSAIEFVEGKKLKNFDLDLAGGDVLMMGITTILYIIILFLIEFFKNNQSISNTINRIPNIPYKTKQYDSDVQREMDIVENSTPKDYNIRVNKIRKIYRVEGDGIEDSQREDKTTTGKKINYKVAVDRISFGVKNGECFGLLGVNGAGKTTTFKMLCGEYPPTAGEAHIMGYNISTELYKAIKYIGYCPQFDALSDLLTCKEHLMLYSAIKGIPEQYRAELVEKKLEEMALKRYENVVSSALSGGNKRKLSVAIAMLGNPPIVFLDEPSTGMDPEARRFMWDIISKITTRRKLSSIILTTHSMEEAEALATKMGIMVNGELHCMGSIQQIKNKFGQGYEVEVKVNMVSIDEMKRLISQLKLEFGGNLDSQYIVQVLSDLKKQNPSLFTIPDPNLLIQQIRKDGYGAHLVQQLSEGYVNINLLIEYAITESYGFNIMQFLQAKFGSYQLIEHYQTYFLFKLNTNTSIGQVFGEFEDNKSQLNISQYSVQQATIEQIFNNFAKGVYAQPIQVQQSQDLQMQQVRINMNGNNHNNNDTLYNDTQNDVIVQKPQNFEMQQMINKQQLN